MDSPLVTHVLNTADAVPAARLALSLHRLDPQMALWNLITTGYMPFQNKHCQKNPPLSYLLVCLLKKNLMEKWLFCTFQNHR